MYMQHRFDGGKYTVASDGGHVTALRHGEPWGRDLTGDKLVLGMLAEVDALKEQRNELLCELEKAHLIILNALALMSSMQKRSWGAMNDIKAVAGEGVTRYHERAAVIAKAAGVAA